MNTASLVEQVRLKYAAKAAAGLSSVQTVAGLIPNWPNSCACHDYAARVQVLANQGHSKNNNRLNQTEEKHEYS